MNNDKLYTCSLVGRKLGSNATVGRDPEDAAKRFISCMIDGTGHEDFVKSYGREVAILVERDAEHSSVVIVKLELELSITSIRTLN